MAGGFYGSPSQTMVRTYRSAREYEDDARHLAPQGWRPLSVTPVRPQARRSAGCLSGCGSCLIAVFTFPVALIVALFSLGRVNLAAHPGDQLSVTYVWAPPAVAVTAQQYAQMTSWNAPAFPASSRSAFSPRALIPEFRQPPDDADDCSSGDPDEPQHFGYTFSEWRWSIIAASVLVLSLLGLFLLMTHI